MLSTQIHDIKDMHIVMSREEDLCSLFVVRDEHALIDLKGINSADMRKITKVLSDSPFIYSDQNKEGK